VCLFGPAGPKRQIPSHALERDTALLSWRQRPLAREHHGRLALRREGPQMLVIPLTVVIRIDVCVCVYIYIYIYIYILYFINLYIFLDGTAPPPLSHLLDHQRTNLS
jgi:hypothetical protein